jgi:hypothetical protein
VNPPAEVTIFETGYPARMDGYVTSVTFGWSAKACPAAAKISFYRPDTPGNPDSTYSFFSGGGPFDVPDVPATVPPGLFPGIQVTVPIFAYVQTGDVIAITNVTWCGGPILVQNPASPQPPFTQSSLVLAGDAPDTFVASAGQPQFPVIARAVGAYSSLVVVTRFGVSLLATDPRTGVQAAGVPHGLSFNSVYSSSGYFSIPDFTGDSSFPEVVVKMVNATGSPDLGGDFWFFYAPLTDVSYTITVTDMTTGAIRTYSSLTSSPGQLCGGVDTSAFPGP